MRSSRQSHRRTASQALTPFQGGRGARSSRPLCLATILGIATLVASSSAQPAPPKKSAAAKGKPIPAPGPKGSPSSRILHPSSFGSPAILSAPQLGLSGPAASLAVSSDGRRVYVGRRHSYDRLRRNLIVATLGPDGRLAGAPRRYPESLAPLPEQTHITLTALLPDPTRRKLYLAHTAGSAKPQERDDLLTVYDLSPEGEPTGKPRTYPSGNPNKSVMALARHPRLNRLYLVGWGGTAVYVYTLNEKGEPQGAPKAYPVGGQGKYAISVSPGGERLYLGTYPDQLEILDLDRTGAPSGPPRVFTAGQEKQYLRFEYTPQALYVRRTVNQTEKLAVWPLGADGNPAGPLQLRDDLPAAPFAVDPTRRKLWQGVPSTFKDALTGAAIPEGAIPASTPLPLPPGKAPVLTRAGSPRFREKPLLIALGSGGHPVLLTEPLPRGPLGNRFAGYHLRVSVLEAERANGPAAGPLTLSLLAHPQTHQLGTTPTGEAGAWTTLDPVLRDRLGAVFAQVQVEGAPLERLKLRLEIAEGPGTKTLKTFTEEVRGNTVGFFVPGYAFEPPAARTAAIELLSQHAQKYLAAAHAVALKPEERPRQFVVSSYHLMGGQGHLGQLRAQAEALASLGINTVNAYNWGGLPPEQVDQVLDGFGLHRRSVAVYSPPSYFHFDGVKMSREALDRWAQELVRTTARTHGGSLPDIVDFKLSDEPGWYYPTMLKEVRENAVWLEYFRAYLRREGMTPQDFGQPSWDGVFPLGASEATDLPKRRLFYWTARFFPDAAVRGHALAREALERAFEHPVNAAVNWNNWGSRWYVPSPGQKIANNPVVGPDSAYGSFHWLDSGRQSAHMLWTEDWFGDQEAQTWSYNGDLLRSGSMLGRQPFGGYVVGLTLGAHPEGAKYKILSLLGHGAKTVDFFTWGPEFLFPGNCWSERLEIYKPLAEALRLVGRSERVLFPGKPERGKVAVFLPSSSSLWQPDPRMPHYHQETWALHAALTHAGYTVDFVDDEDLAGGQLPARGYTTLYLTGPNVARKAQEAVQTWTAAGGHLVVLPGAATADEYNTPTTLLEPVLGVKDRTPVRDAAPQLSENLAPADTLTLTDPAQVPTGDSPVVRGSAPPPQPLYGPITQLELDGARPIAKLKSGSSGIAQRTYEKGTVWTYAFFPGWQYWVSPDRSVRSRLPRNWSAGARNVAVAPVRQANTPRPAWANVPGVEVCRLQSEKGVALVLLNWTDQPLKTVTITVPKVAGIRKVTSVERSPITGAAQGDTVKLTLPLKSVDVLLLE